MITLVKRAAPRLIAPASILLVLAAGIARAEPMSPQDLADNRRSCLAACTEQAADPSRCANYCDCSVKGLSEQVSQEEYEAGKVAISSKQIPPKETVDKLTAIAKSCAAQLK